MKLEELDSQLEKNQLSGFWRTRVPSHASEAPYLWKWEPLLDGLLKASETIGIDQAERRAIRLVSPHLPIKSTSHTLQITFSIVNPGEVAKAHRHNMAAIRFVVQGKGAYTAVDGEKFYMEEGDLILTPNWTWHDHHNESEDPIIWLDGLDGPLIQSLNVLFFEDSEKPEQEITRQTGESLARMGFARTPKQEESYRRGVPFRYSPSRKPTRRSRPWATAIAIRTTARYCATSIRPPAATPIRPCPARFSSLKLKKSLRPIAIPVRRSTMSSKGRGAPESVKDFWNGKKATLSSCRSGNGMPMKISATTRRFFFP